MTSQDYVIHRVKMNVWMILKFFLAQVLEKGLEDLSNLLHYNKFKIHLLGEVLGSVCW